MSSRICFVLPVHSSFTMGGSQYQIELLIDYLKSNSSVDIVYIANNYNKDNDSFKYHVEKVRSSFSMIKSLYLLSSSINLYGMLKEINPDIIYQRVACYQTLICALYANYHNKKMIWHVSSDGDVSPQRFKISLNMFSRYIEKKMVERSVRCAKKIVVQTNRQSDSLFENYGRRADALVRNFNNCPMKQKPKKKTVQVVWIANLKQFKQPEVFIQLAKELHPLTGAKFIMAGKQQGPVRWWRKLQVLINSTDGLEYYGVLTQAKVNSLLEESHIAINTSLVEGFSNVFIQAWMRRVPVISLNVNPDDLLTTKKIGICSKTYQNLRRDTLKLIQDSSLRMQMGLSAYEYSMKCHSMKNVDQIINMFETQG